MSIPDYNQDDDGPKLVYFIAQNSAGQRVYPLFPEGLFIPGYTAQVIIARTVDDGAKEAQAWDLKTMPAMLDQLEELVAHPWLQAGTVYSLHPTRMLSRMLHWLVLARGVRPLASSPLVQPVDLVEAYHGPAILTFNERAAFTPEMMAAHLGLTSDCAPTSNAYINDILLQLCQRL